MARTTAWYGRRFFSSSVSSNRLLRWNSGSTQHESREGSDYDPKSINL